MKKKPEKYFHILLSRLKTPMRQSEVEAVLLDFEVEFASQPEIVQEVIQHLRESKQPKRIPLRWPGLKQPYCELFSSQEEWSPYEIANAIERQGYLSFSTAQYLNTLTNQVPSTYYISINRPSRTRNQSRTLDQFTITTEFLKPRRTTKKIGTLKGQKYVVIQRNIDQQLGMTRKTVTSQQSRPLAIAYTNVERTLIDGIIHPANGGGLSNLRASFEAARGRIRLPQLIAIYTKYELHYPYWQNIGLMLQKTNSERQAALWEKEFGPPRYDFYLDRPFKHHWLKDERWRVFHPPNLFH